VRSLDEALQKNARSAPFAQARAAANVPRTAKL
jgi:hypothetical protein